MGNDQGMRNRNTKWIEERRGRNCDQDLVVRRVDRSFEGIRVVAMTLADLGKAAGHYIPQGHKTNAALEEEYFMAYTSLDLRVYTSELTETEAGGVHL